VLYFAGDRSICELLSYLMHILPSALRIAGRSMYRHNTFSAVVVRCKDIANDQHKWIVGNVLQYADLQYDLFGVVPYTGGGHLLHLMLREHNVVALNCVRGRFPALWQILACAEPMPSSHIGVSHCMPHL